MQFAINWSSEAAELVTEGTIEIDLFKCPMWDNVIEKASSQKPAYIHFPIVIGDNQQDKWDFATYEKWLKNSDTCWINSHITPMNQYFVEDISVDDLSEALAKEVEVLVNYFGAENVIIENCPYWEHWLAEDYLPQGMQTELFHNITNATGCGLLLDVSHAVLTCETLDFDWHDYLNALPVHKIRELHITGIGTWTTGDRADHMPLTDDDWHKVEWCFGKIKSGAWKTPEIVAFEYGGVGKLKEWCGSDKSKIATQVPRLREIGF